MPVADYFNRVNPDLLALIPPDAKVVLEIGCGAGALCEAYRRVNPGVKWLGYEINGDAAREAEKRGIDVLHQDVEEGYLDSMTIRDTDCVIFGDVLEHLHDPWKALKRLTSNTKPGAQVLACIPNVQHWSIIRDLMAGHWRYANEGLLDRTHLRFFTLEGIREMFDQAGLQVFEIRGRDICNEGFDDWVNAHLDRHTFSPEMRAYQYIVRAVKPPAEIKPLHIHAITAEECCARPRIHEPFAMLGTIPGVRCTTVIPDFSAPPCDILIQQRLRRIRWDLQRIFVDEAIVVAEVDDDPAALQGMSNDNYAVLRAVHAIQCSTERVAETCREFNPHVMVFENQIAELPAWEYRSNGHDIQLFCGWQNRTEDWKPILPALLRVLADYKDGPHHVSVNVIHDREFYDALPSPWKRFWTFAPYEQYRYVLRHSDIALLPLEPGRFNEHKSDLKFLECAAEGVAVLASETVYGDVLHLVCELDGRKEAYGMSKGFVYKNLISFESMLRYLINEPENRRVMTREAYAYVRDHRLLSQHYKERHAWYLELLATRNLLHVDLLARCPELASTALASGQAR